MYPEHCDFCEQELEEGRIGLCDDCMQTSMTAYCNHCEKRVKLYNGNDYQSEYICAESCHDNDKLSDFQDKHGNPMGWPISCTEEEQGA
jgi:hypothetical protein